MLKKIVSSILVLTFVLSFSITSFANDYSLSRGSYGYQVVTTTSGLNVRTGPGTGYSKVKTISGGSIVYVDRYSGNWGHISTGSLDGYWICTDYTISATWYRNYNKIQTPNNKNVYLRKGPSTSFGSIAKIPSGTMVINTYKTKNGWTYVKYGNSYGWVYSQYIH